MKGRKPLTETVEWRRSASAQRPHPRQRAWQEKELTAFFHFGMNTFTGREWGSGSEDPNIFQPTELDCDQWVRSVKAAGFKLAIITAKHHDGFCLWPSAHTDHTVASSSWRQGKGDVVSDFAAACRRHNLETGLYLSPWDRHDKRYGTEAYNDYFVAQLEEVIEAYGPFGEFWFDGACAEGANGRKQVYDWERYYSCIRERQPNAAIAIVGPDVRWVGNESGLAKETQWSVVPESELGQGLIEKAFQAYHFEGVEDRKRQLRLREFLQSHRATMWLAPERKMPPSGPPVWYPSECDVSIRPGWFFHARENALVKSLRRLLKIYHASVGRNAVLLLNIPPDRRGLVHEIDERRLSAFGAALESLYSHDLSDRADAITKESSGEAGSAEGAVSRRTGTKHRPVLTRTLGWSEPVRFDRLVLSEDIREGQQVESFVVEARSSSGRWKTIARGSTIGYKRILLLRRPIATTKIRLHILAARGEVSIKSLSAFLPVGKLG